MGDMMQEVMCGDMMGIYEPNSIEGHKVGDVVLTRKDGWLHGSTDDDTDAWVKGSVTAVVSKADCYSHRGNGHCQVDGKRAQTVIMEPSSSLDECKKKCAETD